MWRGRWIVGVEGKVDYGCGGEGWIMVVEGRVDYGCGGEGWIMGVEGKGGLWEGEWEMNWWV